VCAGDDEVGKKIFEDEEDDAGEDDGDDGEAPATHVPSTSTTTTTVQDGLSPTRLRSNKIKWKQLLRAMLSPGERHQGALKLIIRPQESSATLISVRHSQGPEILLTFFHLAFVATFELKDIRHTLSDPNWVNAMHEKLENFERNQV
jgi:hypothetical protein